MTAKNPTVVEVSGGSYKLTELLGVLRYDLSDAQVRPYVLGGFGAGISGMTDLQLD